MFCELRNGLKKQLSTMIISKEEAIQFLLYIIAY